MEHTGWRSRGYIPHCDRRGYVQHIVFGLAAVPAQLVASAPDDVRERAAWWDAAFDRGAGACVLTGEAARMVEDALIHFDGERYRLLAWCVMPNHVHVMAGQFDGAPLDRVVHAWKSYTATGSTARLAAPAVCGVASTSTDTCARTNSTGRPSATSK